MTRRLIHGSHAEGGALLENAAVQAGWRHSDQMDHLGRPTAVQISCPKGVVKPSRQSGVAHARCGALAAETIPDFSSPRPSYYATPCQSPLGMTGSGDVPTHNYVVSFIHCSIC